MLQPVPLQILLSARGRSCRARRISLGLDIGRSDHPFPLRGLLGNVVTKLGRSHWYRIAAKVGEALDHRRIGEARIDLLVELYDDFGGNPIRRTNAKPRARFIA